MYFVYVYVLIIMPKEKQIYYKSKENIHFFNYPLILLRNNKMIFSVLIIQRQVTTVTLEHFYYNVRTLKYKKEHPNIQTAPL